MLNRNVSPWLFARVRGFEGPEHAPRTSTGARACAVVYTMVPCVPRGREHETRRRAGREKNAEVRNRSIWYIVKYLVRCKYGLIRESELQ